MPTPSSLSSSSMLGLSCSFLARFLKLLRTQRLLVSFCLSLFSSSTCLLSLSTSLASVACCSKWAFPLSSLSRAQLVRQATVSELGVRLSSWGEVVTLIGSGQWWVGQGCSLNTLVNELLDSDFKMGPFLALSESRKDFLGLKSPSEEWWLCLLGLVLPDRCQLHISQSFGPSGGSLPWPSLSDILLNFSSIRSILPTLRVSSSLNSSTAPLPSSTLPLSSLSPGVSTGCCLGEHWVRLVTGSVCSSSLKQSLALSTDWLRLGQLLSWERVSLISSPFSFSSATLWQRVIMRYTSRSQPSCDIMQDWMAFSGYLGGGLGILGRSGCVFLIAYCWQRCLRAFSLAYRGGSAVGSREVCITKSLV